MPDHHEEEWHQKVSAHGRTPDGFHRIPLSKDESSFLPQVLSPY